jgi:Pyruvate/2-oxoacid:ferredoxin oxidoreductase delta subunit
MISHGEKMTTLKRKKPKILIFSGKEISRFSPPVFRLNTHISGSVCFFYCADRCIVILRVTNRKTTPMHIGMMIVPSGPAGVPVKYTVPNAMTA